MADFESNNQEMADLESNNKETVEDDLCLLEDADDSEWDVDESFYEVCFWIYFIFSL